MSSRLRQNLMAQYHVSGKVGEYLEIARRVQPEEYAQALEAAEELGLRLDARSRDHGLALEGGVVEPRAEVAWVLVSEHDHARAGADLGAVESDAVPGTEPERP